MHLHHLTDTPSPALVIDLAAVRHNIQQVRAWLPEGDLARWRPHVKTLKVAAPQAELIRAGVRHFKCATTREAAVLLNVAAAEGEPIDLLVAYPHVQPALGHLADLARRHPEARLSVLCEHPDHLLAVPDELGVFIDVNLGMDRTGVAPEALDLIIPIARAAGERYRGLHGYEGHVHAGPASARRAEVFAALARLETLRLALAAADVTTAELVTSGTPSFRHALAFEPFQALPPGTVHRVSPGTVVYHDARSAELKELGGLTWAAVVLSRIISQPLPTRVTCDAGSKALAAEVGDPCAQVLGHDRLTARTPSEEHLPLDGPASDLPPHGAPVLLVPRHVCPTVNLADHAVLIDGDRLLGEVAVAARGHA